MAALPIVNPGADELLQFHKRIIFGLLDKHIKIALYACDGTEVERAVQRLFVESAERVIRKVIKNPHSDLPDTVITVGVFQGQPIVMIQDSKHGLKTFRNNLFSGARLLTIGNFTALYRRIEALAYEEGSPLYHRDVHNLDRQDDNAAARLFSDPTIDFLSRAHPNFLGEIVYLFVFGELIDAYQNRHITHRERIKMVMRARYFVDYWRMYLARTGYKEAQYLISRESIDIVKYLIDGLIGLVAVYRDHHGGHVPLLPWLHSTETCEHVFGEARKIMKDFTMLDFFYMMTKLRVKLRMAILQSHQLDFKSRASGYTHTYTDSKHINLAALSQYPTDVEIQDAAKEAMDETDSLFILLGVNVSILRAPAGTRTQLPSINSWLLNHQTTDEIEIDSEYDDLNDNDDEDDTHEDEVTELQAYVNLCQNDLSLPREQFEKVTRLACAAAALVADDMGRVYVSNTSP